MANMKYSLMGKKSLGAKFTMITFFCTHEKLTLFS